MRSGPELAGVGSLLGREPAHVARCLQKAGLLPTMRKAGRVDGGKARNRTLL